MTLIDRRGGNKYPGRWIVQAGGVDTAGNTRVLLNNNASNKIDDEREAQGWSHCIENVFL